jgi:hypothetical protein
MCFISVLPRSDKTVLHLTSVDSFHFQFADSLSRFQNETTVRSKISESATRSGNSLTYFADRDPKPLGEIHMLALLLQKAVLCRNLFPEKKIPPHCTKVASSVESTCKAGCAHIDDVGTWRTNHQSEVD